jgi:nitronate monooxygenase
VDSPPVEKAEHTTTGANAEETSVTAIDRLNELLEAERAGVDALSRLFPEARSPEMQKLFEDVRDDEAWSCAGLVRSIKTMGGTPSEKKGDFADKVMAEPTLPARLRLLNRGQGWVVKRLDALLAEPLPESVSGFLADMRTRHLDNIATCERLADSLS